MIPVQIPFNVREIVDRAVLSLSPTRSPEMVDAGRAVSPGFFVGGRLIHRGLGREVCEGARPLMDKQRACMDWRTAAPGSWTDFCAPGGHRAAPISSERECERQTPEMMKAAAIEDAVVKGTERIDPQDAQLRAISSERGAFSGVHFRVTGDSLLRPAGRRLRYRRPLAGKGRSDRGYRPREASPGPRSSVNGVRREPAAHVTGARLPNYPRGSGQTISFPQQRPNMKVGQAIARRSRGNFSSLRPALRARFGRGSEIPVRVPFLSKVVAHDPQVAV